MNIDRLLQEGNIVSCRSVKLLIKRNFMTNMFFPAPLCYVLHSTSEPQHRYDHLVQWGLVLMCIVD